MSGGNHLTRGLSELRSQLRAKIERFGYAVADIEGLDGARYAHSIGLGALSGHPEIVAAGFEGAAEAVDKACRLVASGRELCEALSEAGLMDGGRLAGFTPAPQEEARALTAFGEWVTGEREANPKALQMWRSGPGGEMPWGQGERIDGPEWIGQDLRRALVASGAIER